MSYDLIIANSIGVLPKGYVIHSPSRWSEIVPEKERHFNYYPFYLAYLSTILKTNTPLKIKLLDGCLEKLDSNNYLNKIIKYRPKFLFMDPAANLYHDNLNLALELKKKLKTIVLFGGPYASVYPQQTLQDGIDFVFTGQYENSVLSFFNKEKYKQTKKIFSAENNITFDQFPMPEDEDISRFDYAVPGEPSSEFKEIQIYATRGCKGNCPFCVAKNIFYPNTLPEIRKVKDVIKEINYLKNKYSQLEGLFFDEEDHFVNQDFIRQFSTQLIQQSNNLKIEAMGRWDHIPEYLLPQLSKAGYYKLRLGVETFDPHIQDSLNKKIPVQKIENFLLACKKNHIKVYLTFQVGLPESTEKKDQYTLSIVSNFLRKKLITNVQVSIYTPFPGTPFYQKLHLEGKLKTEDLTNYNGGQKSVVNYPDYSQRNIDMIYQKFLQTRNHIQIMNNLISLKIFSKLYYKFKQNSFKRFTIKLFKRFISELKYLYNQRLTK